VEEQLQILDLFQEMVGPTAAPTRKCPHMKPESASLDSGMVSYLASSRFGPAILTTYAQQVCLDYLHHAAKSSSAADSL